MDIATRLSDVINLNIVVDTIATARQRVKTGRWISLLCPVDPSVFRDDRIDRDLDISFIGSVTGAYAGRMAGIDALCKAGIRVKVDGGQREAGLTVEKYARYFQRSKISLNFSWSPGGHQTKGRVIEATLCGSMLMETENQVTPQWFTPGVEYVQFSDFADLVDKARYYLEHEDERRAVAAAGHARAVTNYAGDVWWKTVLKVAGILSAT